MFSTNQIIRGGLENSSLARRSCCRILLAASFLALLSVSGSVKARDQTPFKASFAGSDFATFPDDCTVSVRHIDEGEATHLGRCTYTSTTIADDCVGGLPGHDDDVTLTAANGDQLFGISPESTTQVDDSDPARIQLVGESIIIIIGGTGRFIHSTGTFLMSFVAKLYEATALPDGTLVVPNAFTLDGTLTSVGADKR